MKQKNSKRNNKEDLELKRYHLKKALMVKGIYASFVWTVINFAIAIVLFVIPIWWAGAIFLTIGLFQLVIEIYIFYNLNWGFSNIGTIMSWKKAWIPMLLTGNILGAIYIGLLINKK